MLTENNNKNLCISLPTAIKTKIDRLYQSKYTSTDLNKIYFLVHIINKKKSYPLNNGKHAWMLSLKCGEVSEILHRLVSNKIIQIEKEFTIGSNSNIYSMATPYDYKSPDCFHLNYYAGQIKFPTWVQRWVADGGNAKDAETTNWVKVPNEKPVKKVSKSQDEKDLIIAAQAKEIAMLKAQLAALSTVPNYTPEAKIKPFETIKVETDAITSSTQFTAANGQIFTVENVELYEVELIELIKQKYKRTLPSIFCGGKVFDIERGVVKEFIKEPELI